MSKMIQIRNVSDETHRILKTRAASAGMSLSDYIKRDLEQWVRFRSLEEFDADLQDHGPRADLSRSEILEALDEARTG